MRLVDGGNDLPEEVASVWFTKSSAGSHVAVHVPVAGGEHQVDVLLTHHNFLNTKMVSGETNWKIF